MPTNTTRPFRPLYTSVIVSLTILLAIALCLCSTTAEAHPAESSDRPNVVVILADDLGYGDLGCYGHPKFKTPNLDRMAAEGARLTHFNTPMPFCAPTCASLLTGRYPFRCGMNGNPAPDGGPAADKLALPEGEVTLAQLFHDAGYATGMVGKWHLGHKRAEQMPAGRGFDEYLGIRISLRASRHCMTRWTSRWRRLGINEQCRKASAVGRWGFQPCPTAGNA